MYREDYEKMWNNWLKEYGSKNTKVPILEKEFMYGYAWATYMIEAGLENAKDSINADEELLNEIGDNAKEYCEGAMEEFAQLIIMKHTK